MTKQPNQVHRAVIEWLAVELGLKRLVEELVPSFTSEWHRDEKAREALDLAVKHLSSVYRALPDIGSESVDPVPVADRWSYESLVTFVRVWFGGFLPNDYHGYLRSEAWKERRARAIEAAGGRCQVCNSNRSLNVHHRTYERVMSEIPGDLIVLCETCHGIFHRNGRLAKPSDPEPPIDAGAF